jgi:hypothetical protein
VPFWEGKKAGRFKMETPDRFLYYFFSAASRLRNAAIVAAAGFLRPLPIGRRFVLLV